MAANVDKIASVALSLNQSPKQQADAAPQTSTSTAPPPAPPPAPELPSGADVRLVIEEDKAAQTFVYKTVDRVTGKVISQFPREQLLKLRENPAYAAGSLVKTKA
jgi:flagellar protein FlaG